MTHAQIQRGAISSTRRGCSALGIRRSWPRDERDTREVSMAYWRATSPTEWAHMNSLFNLTKEKHENDSTFFIEEDEFLWHPIPIFAHSQHT